jgi:uncharacterized membrane protein HdeD (DUF308 family)
LTKHIPFLAAFQVAQGCLESVWGFVFAFSPGDGPYAMHLALLGLAASFAGLVRVVAGLLNVLVRGRGLGMAVLVLGLMSGVTCCCLPTSVALCAYGLVVYTNDDVRRAFARGSIA